jgi:hypothetical protein
MEAHAGRIQIPTEAATRSLRGRLRGYLSAAKQRRRERAVRAHALRANGISSPSIPGSEHTHLLGRRGY